LKRTIEIDNLSDGFIEKMEATLEEWKQSKCSAGSVSELFKHFCWEFVPMNCDSAMIVIGGFHDEKALKRIGKQIGPHTNIECVYNSDLIKGLMHD
jgi:hypothetical protein